MEGAGLVGDTDLPYCELNTIIIFAGHIKERREDSIFLNID